MKKVIFIFIYSKHRLKLVRDLTGNSERLNCFYHHSYFPTSLKRNINLLFFFSFRCSRVIGFFAYYHFFTFSSVQVFLLIFLSTFSFLTVNKKATWLNEIAAWHFGHFICGSVINFYGFAQFSASFKKRWVLCLKSSNWLQSFLSFLFVMKFDFK